MQTFLNTWKKYSQERTRRPSLSLPAFEYMLMILGNGKAIGFNKLTAKLSTTTWNNVAPGHLKVFAGHGMLSSGGLGGRQESVSAILQMTGSGFADKGVGGGRDGPQLGVDRATSLYRPPIREAKLGDVSTMPVLLTAACIAVSNWRRSSG